MPIGYDSGMLKRLTSADREVLGRGVYGAGESLRLLNFRKAEEGPSRAVSRQTVSRWLRGYELPGRRRAQAFRPAVAVRLRQRRRRARAQLPRPYRAPLRQGLPRPRSEPAEDPRVLPARRRGGEKRAAVLDPQVPHRRQDHLP